jgi:hypothetical protein
MMHRRPGWSSALAGEAILAVRERDADDACSPVKDVGPSDLDAAADAGRPVEVPEAWHPRRP